MKTESINPFNQAELPEQHARYEQIIAAIQAGKTNEEIFTEFKCGPKSADEIRAKLNPKTEPPTAPMEPTPNPSEEGNGKATAASETAPVETKTAEVQQPA